MGKFNLSAWAIKEQSLTLYLILMTLIMGIAAFILNGRAEDPQFSVNTMVVTASWPGASVKQMEEQVADPLAKRLEEIDWFDRVETKIRPGQVEMLVNFADNTPHGISEQLFYQVRKRLGDTAKTLPKGVIGPFFQDDFKDVYFTLYSLTASEPSLPQTELVKVAETMKKALRRVEGVKKVVLIGEQKPQIFVDFDLSKLFNLGISIEQIKQQIGSQLSVMNAGFIETQGPRLQIRPHQGAKDTLQALKQLPIQIDHKVWQLGALADIHPGFETPPKFLVRDRGHKAIVLGVVMKENTDGLKLEKALKQFEANYTPQLPAGVKLDQITNQADAIHLALDTFQLKFVAALLVVMLVSFIALGFRAGIIVALAVPLTLSLAFVFMKVTGIDFNRISLGALIIALGLLVDDAIISIEMMIMKMEQGIEKVKSAAYAWTLTAAPMLVGTLVTVMGFLPIGMAQSRVGEYAGGIFWVTGIALISSWLVAVWFTPYLGVKLLPNTFKSKVETDPFDRPFYRGLRKGITFCVRHKWLIVFMTVIIFVASVIGLKKKVEKQFFPSSDRPELLIDVNLPEGSSFEATNRIMKRIEKQLQSREEVRSVSSYVGRGSPRFFLALNPELPNPAYGNIIVVAKDWHARDHLQAALQKQIDNGVFAEARVRVHPLLFGPPVPWPVAFRVVGEDYETLINIANQIRQKMKQYPFLIDPHLSWETQVPNLQLKWNLQRLAQLGMTPAQVATQLNAYQQGVVAAQVLRGIRTTEVRLRGQPDQVTPAKLSAVPITLPSGKTVPLSQLAEVTVGQEYALVERRNREPTVSVYAEVRPGIQPPDATAKVWQGLQSIVTHLPPGYRVEIGGSVEESSKAQNSIKVQMPLMLLIVTFLIMLYVRSFTSLFMVLVTAPLGVIGAVAAMLLFHQPLGFVANLGIIALGGILMRNTLILIAQIKEDYEVEKMPISQAVIEATVKRSRPVILTALAAVFAFMPLTESVFWGPMAYVLIGGIFMGTFITIFFLPALYAVWYRIK